MGKNQLFTAGRSSKIEESLSYRRVCFRRQNRLNTSAIRLINSETVYNGIGNRAIDLRT